MAESLSRGQVCSEDQCGGRWDGLGPWENVYSRPMQASYLNILHSCFRWLEYILQYSASTMMRLSLALDKFGLDHWMHFRNLPVTYDFSRNQTKSVRSFFQSTMATKPKCVSLVVRDYLSY